jgi:hypothetical protein
MSRCDVSHLIDIETSFPYIIHRDRGKQKKLPIKSVSSNQSSSDESDVFEDALERPGNEVVSPRYKIKYSFKF